MPLLGEAAYSPFPEMLHFKFCQRMLKQGSVTSNYCFSLAILLRFLEPICWGDAFF